MIRTFLPALGLLTAATSAAAHEKMGYFHVHPHGSEAAIAAAMFALAAAVVLWRVLRQRR